MPLLVRTWNLFHGNSVPTSRRAHLDEMVRLAAADRPDVLCLQEVPVWALPKLGGWADMRVFGEIAARAKFGPFPSVAELGQLLTSFHHGLLRSLFTGQANAILVGEGYATEDYHALVLNPWRYRRAGARRLALGPVARLAWAKERRVVQALRLVRPSSRRALLANLHATAYSPDRRLADAELRRAAEFALGLARADEIVVIAGDFNSFPRTSKTIPWLVRQGFSKPAPAVDHVLVRGAPASAPDRWEPDRRRLNGLLLSDHAPVDVRIE